MCSSLRGDIKEYIEYIRNTVPEAVLYEQLAEECNELAQACLKKARKLRGDSYTPISMEVIDDSLNEEYTDVQLCANTCGLDVDLSIEHKKLVRWIKRNEK